MSDYRQKIQDRETIANACAHARTSGKMIGFTSGTFDILHAGHAQYLAEARSLCDILIAGINSDASVRRYKGPNKPIHSERQRAEVVAALEAIDYVFLFDEPNTNRSVEILKPDLYIKGSDRRKEELTSAPIVEGYGGKVILLPLLPGVSTTGSIHRIVERFAGEVPLFTEMDPTPPAPAVFLDRDGTIIEQVDYLSDPNQVKELPGAFEAIRAMRNAGARIAMITNQPGIGLGYLSKDEFFAVNKRVLSEASKIGALFDRIYYCPHSKAEGCDCRKPGTALIERAARELNIDVMSSFMIGDMTSDVELARRAGCISILVLTGRAGKDGLYDLEPDYLAKNLTEAARIIAGTLSTRALQCGYGEIVHV